MNAFAARLMWHADRQPSKTAVVSGSTRWTYRELADAVRSTAAYLLAQNVEPRSVVSSRLPNGVGSVLLCYASSAIGAVHNPMLPAWGRREVDFVIDQASSRVYVEDEADLLGGVRTARALPSATPFEAAGTPRAAAADADDAPAFLVYTSGSTSAPKGVLHSARTLWAECEAQATYHELRDDEVFVMPSPVAHVSGLLYGVLLPLWLGATSVLMARWDPDEFLALVTSERGTFSGGATPFLRGALEHHDPSRHDVSSLRVFPCGGADVPPDLIRDATERLGVRTGRGYGSTEFPSITSAAGPGEPLDRRAETDGRPIGANQVRIRDGEIEAHGPELFLGYLDAALDDAALTADGWLRTGDLGSIDDAGYLTVVGRAKDIVIRLGEKISARELEELLASHPGIAEVAVVAVPDARTGERACACVVARAGSRAPMLDELCAHLEARDVSRRKLPEQLVVVDSLPLTPSGKVNKAALRAQLAARAT